MEGQPELFEQPPDRSIIVPVGCSAWWGVDPSTLLVAIGTVTSDLLRGWSLAAFEKRPHPRRLVGMYDAAFRLAADLAVDVPPGLVFFEQPGSSTQRVNHELEWAAGAIAAGVLAGAGSVIGAPPVGEVVVGSHWKKVVLGNGAVRKTERVPGRKSPRPLPLEEYAGTKWARSVGYTGVSMDEIDAGAMAECARRDVRLVQR